MRLLSIMNAFRLHRLACLALLVIAGGLPWGSTVAETNGGDVRSRVVRIRVVKNVFQTAAPWATSRVQEEFGTGLLVASGHVLTSLELVRFAISAEVFLPDGPRVPRPAEVSVQGADCGLALLKLTDSATEEPTETAGEETGEQEAAPAESVDSDTLQYFSFVGEAADVRAVRPNSVLAVGATASGLEQRQLILTAIERDLIENSDIDRRWLLRFQESAAGPPETFRGGPVLVDGKLAGILASRSGPAYAIEVGVVKAFLADAADREYQGLSFPGFAYDPIDGAAMRRYLGLGQTGEGVYIRRVDFRSPAWQRLEAGDILLSVNGAAVTQDAAVNAGEGTNLDLGEYFSGLRGEVTLKLKRGSRDLEIKIEARPFSGLSMARRRLEDRRRYFLTAGLVFQELDYDLIHDTSAGRDALLRHRYENFGHDRIGEAVDRDVVLVSRLEDPINNGAGRFINAVVHRINGRRVRNLMDFAVEWKRTRGEYVVVEFLDHAAPLILAKRDLPVADERVDRRYQVQENGRVR